MRHLVPSSRRLVPILLVAPLLIAPLGLAACSRTDDRAHDPAAGDDLDLELEEGARILESLAERVGARPRKRVLEAVAGLRRGRAAPGP